MKIHSVDRAVDFLLAVQEPQKKHSQRCAFLLCAVRLRCTFTIAVWARLIVVAQCCVLWVQ
jgi:hypothetical protein